MQITPEQYEAIVDRFARHQKFSVQDLYPVRTDGLCACGCGKHLSGKQSRWASKACSKNAVEEYYILTGYADVIRKYVWKRDKGQCACCGSVVQSRWGCDWQADHIKEVADGGGGCGLDNFQTLCSKCHKEKTQKSAAARRAK